MVGSLFYLSLLFIPPQAGQAQNLIDSLGDDCCLTRKQAQSRLQYLVKSKNGMEVFRLVKSNLDNPDPEIAKRCKTVLVSYYDVRPSNYPVYPWIDQLPASYDKKSLIVNSCLTEVRWGSDVCGYEKDWPDYRAATGVLVKRLLDSGNPRCCVQKLLDDMVETETEYRKRSMMSPYSVTQITP